ncbi:MAG: hypothetical protein AB7R89_29440 [Dehalococcoidia bacterium]
MKTRLLPDRRRLRRGVVLGAIALLATLLTSPLVGPPTAAIAQSQGQSATYNNCNDIDTFTVPAGVTRLDVEAWGAQGVAGGESSNGGHNAQATLVGYAYHSGGTGGAGASVSGTFPVTPGQQFTVIVGCSGGHGDNTGVGYTDGGPHGHAEGASGYDGGAGGGSSALVPGPAGSSSGSPLIVAAGGGGGGGAGITGSGGNGGDAGTAPDGGNSGTGPGSGDGGCGACVSGVIGGSGTGSSVLEDGGGGGGGGGGYPLNGGGGHGADEGGGGGGAGGAGQSYTASSVTNVTIGTSTRSGDGLIVLSWIPGEPGQRPPGSALPARPPFAVPAATCNDTAITPTGIREFVEHQGRCATSEQFPTLPSRLFP